MLPGPETNPRAEVYQDRTPVSEPGRVLVIAG